MSTFKELVEDIGTPDLSPEAIEKLAHQMRDTRHQRAGALSRTSHHELVDVLEKIISQLDMANIQIQDAGDTVAGLETIAVVRDEIITLLGIDKET